MGDPPEKMYVIPPKNKAKLGHRPAKTVERYSVKPHKIHEDVTINIAKGERYQPPATPIPYPGQQYPFPGQPGQPVQPSQRIPVEETIPRYIKQEPTAPMFDDDDDDDDDMGDEGTAPPFNEIQMDENIANYLHQKGVYGEFEKGEDGKWVYVIHNRNDHGDIIKTENPEDETPMGLELTIPNRGGVSTAITSVDSGKMDTRPVPVTVKQEEGDQLGVVTESKDLSPFNTTDLIDAYQRTLQIIIPEAWQCLNQRYLTIQGSDTKKFEVEKIMLIQMMNDLGEMLDLLHDSLLLYEQHEIDDETLLQTFKIVWQEFDEKYRIGKEYQKALQDINFGGSNSDSALRVVNDITASITQHYLVSNPLIHMKNDTPYSQFSDYVAPEFDLFDLNNRSVGARVIDRLTTVGNKVVSYLPILPRGRDDEQYTTFVKPYVDAFCNTDGIDKEIKKIPKQTVDNYLLVMNDLTGEGMSRLNPFRYIKAAFNTSKLSILFSAIIGDSEELDKEVYNSGVDRRMIRARSIILDCVRLLFTMAYGAHGEGGAYFEGFQKHAIARGPPLQRILMNGTEALQYPTTIPDINTKESFGILQTLTHIIMRYPLDLPFTRAAHELYYYRNSNINNPLTPDFVWEIIRKNLPLQRSTSTNLSLNHKQQFSATGFGEI